jgi:signal transduction histidine kinase
MSLATLLSPRLTARPVNGSLPPGLTREGGITPPKGSLEEEVARLRSRIEELEREKEAVNAFATVAAHELMEPLVMIEAHASLLANGQRAGSGLPADGIGRAAARLRRLAEAVLLDARADEEGIARQPVDLGVVVGDVLALLAPEIEARAANVVVTGELPTVDGDEALLTSLLTNLITNALKYGRREHATISIEAQRLGPEWRVSVADDGVPLPESERVLIFEPFKRAPRERRSRGAGLGLAICRSIVERHGGAIGMLECSTGNCFAFTLQA